tara:strand:- start:8788 stop:10326 length:1539 start_codon:yes stop_codon:yes gene_type:complete
MTNNQLDIIICIMPKINPEAPTVGPSVLKAHLASAGFTCKVIDLNIKLFNKLDEDEAIKYFFENDKLFKVTLGLENYLDELNSVFGKFYDEHECIFLEWLELIKENVPKYIGLSLLSGFSRSPAIKFSQLIRKHLPEVKIIWGGADVGSGKMSFIQKTGLIDHYITSDAEISLVELLKNNLNANGINQNKWEQVSDLNSVLMPNYDDIDWNEYEKASSLLWAKGFGNITNKPVYITGSRGCVRKCTFCNVFEHWPKFKFRTGENIAKEMIYIYETYGRKTFKFTDSLINGSMKHFRSLINILANYNKKTNSKIEWTSQWICKPKSQFTENDYMLMKQSGCMSVEVGVESFSQHIRYHMLKKFSDEDMWYSFDMLRKYKIHMTLLMFVGYPTETEKDHQHTLGTLRKLHREGYTTAIDKFGRLLIYFSFSNTMMLERNPPLPLWHIVKNDITDYKNELDWNYKGNTLEVRLRRLNEVQALLKDLIGQNKTWMAKKSIRRNEETLGIGLAHATM